MSYNETVEKIMMLLKKRRCVPAVGSRIEIAMNLLGFL